MALVAALLLQHFLPAESSLPKFALVAVVFFSIGWHDVLWFRFRRVPVVTRVVAGTVALVFIGILIYASLRSAPISGESRIRVDRIEAGATTLDGKSALIFNIYQSSAGSLPAIGKRYTCSIHMTTDPLEPDELSRHAQRLLADSIWTDADVLSEDEPGSKFFNSCPPVRTTVASDLLDKLRNPEEP